MTCSALFTAEEDTWVCTMKMLDKYLHMLARLHRNRDCKLGYAPHKPLLLLAILDEVEHGGIQENLVRITPELVSRFRAYWKVLVPSGTWRERFVYPFRYLIQDGFWSLIKDGVELSSNELGHPTYIGQLSSLIDGGRFAPDLWQLLQDKTAVDALQAYLLEIYFGTTATAIRDTIPCVPVNYEAEQLIAEAHESFRVKEIREARNDVYYLRHALFPRVVKSLYRQSCAACGIDTRGSNGQCIVDAAHILPFGQFHNNDPRNGVALCKNHHWGFDAGWFTISDDYRILVSPHLTFTDAFLANDTFLRLPDQENYSPAADALAWHRDNVFRR